MVSICYVVSWLTFKAEPRTRKVPDGCTPRGTLQLSGHAPKSTPGAISPNDAPTVDR